MAVKSIGWLIAVMGLTFVSGQFSSSYVLAEFSQSIARIFVICPIELIDQGIYIGTYIYYCPGSVCYMFSKYRFGFVVSEI